MKKLIFTLTLLFISSGLIAQAVEFLTPEEYAQVVSYPEGVTVIEFWADWNSNNAYHIENLTGAKVYRVDVDRFSYFSKRFNVVSLPTVFIYYNGDLIHEDRADITFSKKDNLQHIQDIIDQYRF